LCDFGIPKEELKPFSFFQKRSELNRPSLISLIGCYLTKGIRVKTNHSKAIHLYRLAIELKNSWTMNDLVEMYLKGVKIEKNISKEIDLYRVADKLNNSYG
jgi:TPR repeat protein